MSYPVRGPLGDSPSDVLLTTKLGAPRSHTNLVVRQRLIDRLNAGWDHTLTLISAPAGFGKTTLVSEWVHHCGRLTAWLCLEPSDNDPTRFWAYLVAALRAIEPTIGEGLLNALQSPQPPPLDSSLVALLNDIAAVPQRFTLVIDDYHHITLPTIHRAMSFLIDHLPDNIHLVITTRSVPPLPLARLRGQGQLNELRAADLTFTHEEVAEFLNQVMELGLSTDAVIGLAARTEGWIAGLQMAAASLRGKDTADANRFVQSFTGSNRHILDYLVEEVLRHQPEEIQSFLFQTSILDRLTAPLCNALTGRNDGQECLQSLELGNLFIFPLDDCRCWYRYHHLFADSLRQRLRALDSNLENTLHLRASEWLEQNGLIAPAIDHALYGGDDERAGRLLEATAEMIWGRGEQVTLLAWLERLPETTLCAHPTLCVYHALVLFTAGEYEKAEARLRSAEGAIRACSADVQAEHEGMSNAVRAYIAFFRGDMQAVNRFSQRALDLLPENNLTWQGIANYTLGLSLRWGADLDGAERALTKAVQVSEQAGMIYLTLLTLGNLAAVHEQQGRLRRAENFLRTGLRLAEAKGMLQSMIGGSLYVELGNLLTEWNDLDTAHDLVLKGATLNERAQDLGFLGWAYIYLVRILYARGEYGEAMGVIRKMAQITQRTDVPPWIAHRMTAWQVRILLAQNDRASAAQVIEDYGISVNDDITNQGEPLYMAMAQWFAREGRFEEANYLLDRLHERADAEGRTDRIIKILILEALTFHAANQIEKAIGTLEQALSLAEPEGYIRVFADEGAEMERLLRHAANRGIQPRYVSRILEAFQPLQESTPPAAQALLEPLSDRESEVLRLLATSLSALEIADRLYVAPSTVRSHTKSIYAKLGVHRRLDAVECAKTLGLI